MEIDDFLKLSFPKNLLQNHLYILVAMSIAASTNNKAKMQGISFGL